MVDARLQQEDAVVLPLVSVYDVAVPARDLRKPRDYDSPLVKLLARFDIYKLELALYRDRPGAALYAFLVLRLDVVEV